MRKYRVFALLCLLQLLCINISAAAYSTIIPKSEDEFTYTNPLYNVGGSIPYDFTSPTDLFVDKNDSVYVSDTDKVIRFDTDGQGLEIGFEIIGQAEGIFVTDNLELYVADSSKSQVHVFDENGVLLRQYDKPTEIYFGEKTPYIPVDVAVSDNGKIYIASSGTTDGIITLDQSGKFLGFFGANESAKSIYSFEAMSSGKLGNFLRPTPQSVNDIMIDDKGIVYTSTLGENMGVRKLNYASTDMLEDVDFSSDYIQDFWIDPQGNIYIVNSDEAASINVLTSTGNWLYSFGNYMGYNSNTVGLLQTPSAIAVDSNQVIYVADKATAQVQTYLPTPTVLDLHKGVALYDQGLYSEAIEPFENILKVSNSYPIAYDNKAQALYKDRQYSEALDNFEKSNNKIKYSDAFYFVRDFWIAQNIAIIVGIVLSLVIFKKLWKFFKLKTKLKATRFGFLITFWDEAMLAIYDPASLFYYIKYKNMSNIYNATILYVLGAIVLVGSLFFTGFLFNSITNASDVNIFAIVAGYFFAIGIYLGGNYLVSSIMFGEGTFKQMYIATSYSFVIYILLIPIVTLLSHVLSLNESLVYVGLHIVSYGWMFYLICLSISEIHNFYISKTLANLLITIFTIIVIITVTATFMYLGSNIFTLIGQFIKEVTI